MDMANFPLKGLPAAAGKYFVCVKNETGGYEWKEVYLEPSNPGSIWREVICWSYT